MEIKAKNISYTSKYIFKNEEKKSHCNSHSKFNKKNSTLFNFNIANSPFLRYFILLYTLYCTVPCVILYLNHKIKQTVYTYEKVK